MNKLLLRWGRVLSLLIVFTMLSGMLPLHLLQAYGAETSENEFDLENNDVFGALGFDTSQYPEGYDPESTDNPYGRDQFTANEVLEAFILGTNTYRLAGHNSGIKPENITSTGRRSGNFPTSGYRRLDSGDFDGDGLAGEMAYVANSGVAESPGIAMYFIDSSGECSKYGSKQIVAEGRVSSYRSGGYAAIDWINILQIASGDFDGDGYSEIAVYVPEQGNARVDVYKYQRTSGSGGDRWTDFSKWQVVWSHALSSADVAPNMVSLCAGDFNRDGIDDLAISCGLYVFQGGNAASRAVALFGSRTAMLQTNQPLPLGGDNMYRAALTYGDADGDGVKELVFGAQPFNDLTANKKRCIGVYGYDGSSVVLLSSSVMEVVDGERVDGKWISDNGFDGNYYSGISLACNIAVTAPFEGGGKYIYLDSVLYSYDSGAFEIEYELDDPDINGDGVIDDKDNLGWRKFLGHEDIIGYIEYGACSEDVSGSGAEAFISNFVGDTYLERYEELRILFGSDGKLVKNSLESYPDKEGRLFACFANTDRDDTVLMRYKGEHYIVYTDPRVLAVIASAPYFKDVADAEDGYLDSLETSFGSTTGSGSSTITTVGFEVGGYYSYEGEVFEFEATAGFTFEWEREIAESTEYTVSFNTPGGEDSVAFYSIPTEVYIYEMLVPDGKGGYTQTETTVKIPHTAAVQVLRMDYYTSIASDYKDELPDISGNVITHTLGDPSSYPGSAKDYLLVSQYNGDWAGLSYGQGSISQEISITYEESNTYSFGASASVRFGGGAGGHKGGAYLNFNAGGGYSEVDINGTSFGGTIKNMPVEMEHYGYYFAWKLFSYAYMMNQGKLDQYYFPVISYLVKDVTAPPELPEDFAQNFDNTTDTQVELTWSYGKSASFFYIYRYFDFPEGGGSYLVGTVPASDYKIMYDSEGKPYKAYSFTDKNLSPYTEYQYQIQTERSKAPPLSGMSGILKAKTKASGGYPQLSITPEQLMVYPDRNEILMAEVANITDYTGNTAKYQWQKLTDGIWKDVEGAVNAALVFSKAGTGAAGYYRCRVNVITKSDNTAFSAYTNTAAVVYSKRGIVLSRISAVDNLRGATLSMTVSNAHSGSGSIPSGMVVFELKSETGKGEYIYMAELDSTGKAEIDIETVPQGVYRISAYYSGSRIFKSGFADSIRYFSGIGSGYWLDAADAAVYGDAIPYKLYMMSRSGMDGAAETQEVPVQRYEIYEGDSLYTGNIYNSGEEDAIYAGKAGSIMLRAYYEDSAGAEKYIEAPIYIQKQSITLKIPSAKGALNQAISGDDMKFTVLSGRIAGADSTVFAQNILYTYRNTAGTAVNEADVPKTPGFYTVSGSANAVLTDNYSITVMEGSYIVTGGVYPLKASMRKFEGLHRGVLYMVSPSSAFTDGDTPIELQMVSGTKVVFSAVPHAGYAVYDWYINGVAQGSRETYLACNMFAEETEVEVQFAVRQNIITYGTAKDGGGTVACINDENLESGSIVVQGTELKFKAAPDEGYHFAEWRYTAAGSGTVYSQGVLDADGSSTYTMSMPSDSVSLYGAFQRDSYKLEYSQGLNAVYMGDHDGDSSTPHREIEVASGAYVSGDTVVTIMPKKGYRVDGTSAWLAVGSQGEASADNSSYTLTLSSDTYVQMNVVRGEFKAYLGFEDKELCKGSTISYRIDGGDMSVISGDSYTSPVELSIKGGESFYAEVSAEKDHEFIQWIYIQGGNQENILTQGYGIDAVDNSFILSAVLKHKNIHDITMGQLTEPGASYGISLNGGDYEAASSGDVISVVEGDSLSVRVTLPAGKAVAYWNVDGQSTQASSNTYTFENIVESHNITPVFTGTTYLTVSWPQVSAVINGCTVIPEKGSLTMVSPGGEFKFKLSIREGLKAEGVYTNGTLLTPDTGGIYTISNITRHQVITLVLSDLGITVDGRDIKNLMGQGWKYDVTENRLNLLSNDLTLSGSAKYTDKFSVLIESGVSSVIFHNLNLASQNTESLITSRRSAGLTVTLRGENTAEMKYDVRAKFDNQYVINAQRLIFSGESTGTLNISIAFDDGPDSEHYPINVFGICAESLAVNGGAIDILSKNYMERSNHNDDNIIYGIKAAGMAGIVVKGGELNVEALANSNLQSGATDGEQFPDTFGIYAEKGNMTVEGGSVSITANGSRGSISQYTNIATSETYGIMLKNGNFAIKGGSVSVDSSSKFSNPCGISAHMADVEDGSLKIYAYSYPGAYSSTGTGGRGIILTKSGAEEGALSNSGGIMELRTKTEERNIGKNLTIADGSNWSFSSDMAVSAGKNAMSAVVVGKEEYLASQTEYMKVAMSEPLPAPNVEISVDGGEYESIYPDESSSEKTGDGWKYENNLLTLDGADKKFEIKGMDTMLGVFADYGKGTSDIEPIQITLNNFHGKQLKLNGRKGDLNIYVKGENTLKNDVAYDFQSGNYLESPLYIESFTANIEGEGSLSVINKAEGFAMTSVSYNGDDRNFSQIITVKSGSFLLYGGRSAVFSRWNSYGGGFYPPYDAIEVPNYNNARIAEAGSSAEDAELLPAGYGGKFSIVFTGEYWEYEHNYLKIYDKYAKGSINPQNHTFDKNGDIDGISFIITHPMTGAGLYSVSNVYADGAPICVSEGGSPASSVTTGVAISYQDDGTLSILELKREYLKGLSTDTHRLTVEFQNNDVIYAFVTVKDTTAPIPAADITITPETSAGYKGHSVRISAKLSKLANINDTSLSWTLTGNMSAGTRLIPGTGSNEAVLYIGADETADSLEVRAQLAGYPELVSNTALIAVEVPAVKVHVEPESTELYYKIADRNTQRFTAEVEGLGGEDVSGEVDWKLWGNTKLATRINSSGLLTVDYDETGWKGYLEVWAVSKVYPYVVSNRASVTLLPDEQEPPETVSVMGTATSGGAIKSVVAGYGTELGDIDAINKLAAVESGMKVVFTAEPDNPDTVCVWEVQGDDNYSLSEDGTVLTINEIKGDIIVKVSFKPLKFFDITIIQGENHKISIAAKTPDTGEPNKVREGGTVEFTVIPHEGYYLEDITASGGTVSKTYDSNGSCSVKVSNIASDVSIEAVSNARPFYVSYGPVTGGRIIVNDSKGITVAAENTVPYGTVLTISTEADSDYKPDGLMVNGKEFTTGGTHRVTGNVTITAAFKYVPPKDDNGGGGGTKPPAQEEVPLQVNPPEPVPQPSLVFDDVNEGDWYKEAVDFISARGIVLGIAPNLFGPEEKLTRGQFVVMLMRAYDLEAEMPISDNFADAGDTYYTPYLGLAKTLGLTEGIGNNMFAPEDFITRQDMAVMLYRILKNLDKLTSETAEKSISDFTDAEEISPYAIEAMEQLVRRGILSGYENRIMPRDEVTRAQAAQVLYNILK